MSALKKNVGIYVKMKSMTGGDKEKSLSSAEGRRKKIMSLIFPDNVNSNSCMYYNGEYYLNGTEIILQNEYIKNRKYNGLKLWKYARFSHQTTIGNQIVYVFNRNKCELHDYWVMGYNNCDEIAACRQGYAPYFIIFPHDLKNAIEQIVKPIKLTKEQTDTVNVYLEKNLLRPKMDWEFSGLMITWFVYIAAMIGATIFNAAWLIWPVITFIFLKIRKGFRGE